jgi:hypothetical protein
LRRVLYHQLTKPAPDVTRAELSEVVRRARDDEAYFAVFDANVPLDKASSLLYWPPNYDPVTNTWAGGRPMSEYDPTPEQIVEWALAPRAGKQEA